MTKTDNKSRPRKDHCLEITTAAGDTIRYLLSRNSRGDLVIQKRKNNAWLAGIMVDKANIAQFLDAVQSVLEEP